MNKRFFPFALSRGKFWRKYGKALKIVIFNLILGKMSHEKTETI